MSDTTKIARNALVFLSLFIGSVAAAATETRDELTALSRLSLAELAKVEVTSVSKSAQSLATAPASIYVITHEEIVRSGVLSIPEALRLAPNMQVTQISATEYQIGARGFAGNLEAQNFSNKILILVDGRSVYSPLFSGIAYDAIDVVMDDIDRIEVISGPGATLWGANAMNGVINIITRSAQDSQGTLVRASGGSQESALTARYGGSLGDDAAYRVYAKAFDRGSSELPNGDSSADRWSKAQAGFRTDFGVDRNRVTVQGDYQQVNENVAGTFPDVEFSQMNVLGRWERTGTFATSRLQVFYDHTDRDQPPAGVGFTLDTYDFEFQQTFSAWDRHQIVWGLGRRANDYDFINTPGLAFDPTHRTLDQTNIFAQDTIKLSHAVSLTLGLKFEDNSYSDWSALPDVRVSYAPNDSSLIWAAAARAVRSPTPFDTDVRESFGTTLALLGDPEFKTEKVTAYELGYRAQPFSVLSWSVSAFYNDYEDLRNIEPAPTFFPLRWGNGIEGGAYGVEAWANIQVRPWWRLSPGFRSLHKRLRFSEDASTLLGVQQAGNDPRSQASLKSSMTFSRWTVDAMLRYVGALPEPSTPSYEELSARAAWAATDTLELSVSGFNLLDDRHTEYVNPTGRDIRRSVYAEARWSF